MEKDPYPSLLLLDSKSVRADEGVPKATKGKDAYKKVIGRKFHLATDTEGLIHRDCSLLVAGQSGLTKDRSLNNRRIRPDRDSGGANRSPPCLADSKA